MKNFHEAIQKHTIIIHSEGVDAGDTPEGELPRYEEQFHTVISGYVAWKKIRDHENKPSRLLLYFNGGLNTATRGKRNALFQADCLKRNGFYPVFMVWDTNVLASYREQSSKVRNGFFQDHISPTTPLYWLSDVAASIIRAPQNWTTETARYIDTGVVLDPSEYSLAATATENDLSEMKRCRDHSESPDPRLCLPYVKADGGRLDDKPVTDLRRVAEIGRFAATSPVRALAIATVVDAGREAWNNMVRRTRNTVHHRGEFQAELWDREVLGNRDAVMKRYPRGTGRFARFFHDLEQCFRPFDAARHEAALCDPLINEKSLWRGDLASMKLTLVAHSMGAIVVNELIHRHPDLPYENIVFMAAASTVRETRNALVPLLERNTGTSDPLKVRFFNLMLHPRADAREDAAKSLLPTGSLLEWIDEVLDTPNTVLDRTMGKWRNTRSTWQVFPISVRKHMTFRIFGFHQGDWKKTGLNNDGEPCKDFAAPNPVTHGGFNELPVEFWLPRFWGAESTDGYAAPWRSEKPCMPASD